MIEARRPGGRQIRLALLSTLAAAVVVLLLIQAHIASVGARHDAAVAALEGQIRVLARVIESDRAAEPAAADGGRAPVDLREPAVAAARLQGQMARIVQAKDVTLSSSQALPQVTEDGLIRQPIRLQFEATIEQLVGVLDAIEAGRDLMAVTRISIADGDGTMRRGGAAPGPNRLRIDMTVDAFGRAP